MRIGQYNFTLSTHTNLTMSVNEVVYDGLIRVFGGGRISQYIEDLVRPHAPGTAIEEGYRAKSSMNWLIRPRPMIRMRPS